MDLSPVATAYAAANINAAGLSHLITVLCGSWYEPVSTALASIPASTLPVTASPPSVSNNHSAHTQSSHHSAHTQSSNHSAHTQSSLPLAHSSGGISVTAAAEPHQTLYPPHCTAQPVRQHAGPSTGDGAVSHDVPQQASHPVRQHAGTGTSDGAESHDAPQQASSHLHQCPPDQQQQFEQVMDPQQQQQQQQQAHLINQQHQCSPQQQQQQLEEQPQQQAHLVDQQHQGSPPPSATSLSGQPHTHLQADQGQQHLEPHTHLDAVPGHAQSLSKASQRGCLGGILSNPPYIPSLTMAAGLQAEVDRHEPWSALDGGQGQGLESLQIICLGAVHWLTEGGFIGLETAGRDQAFLVAKLLEEMQTDACSPAFTDIRVVEDCFGVPRFVTASRGVCD